MKTEAERRRWNKAAAVVLAATRSDADKSQEELAKLVGVSRDVIANIESGRKKIELSDLIMICRSLNLDPVKVLNRVLVWDEPWRKEEEVTEHLQALVHGRATNTQSALLKHLTAEALRDGEDNNKRGDVP